MTFHLSRGTKKRNPNFHPDAAFLLNYLSRGFVNVSNFSLSWNAIFCDGNLHFPLLHWAGRQQESFNHTRARTHTHTLYHFKWRNSLERTLLKRNTAEYHFPLVPNLNTCGFLQQEATERRLSSRQLLLFLSSSTASFLSSSFIHCSNLIQLRNHIIVSLIHFHSSSADFSERCLFTM